MHFFCLFVFDWAAMESLLCLNYLSAANSQVLITKVDMDLDAFQKRRKTTQMFTSFLFFFF